MSKYYYGSDSDESKGKGTIVHSDGYGRSRHGSSRRGSTFSESHSITSDTHRIQQSNSTRRPPKGR